MKMSNENKLSHIRIVYECKKCGNKTKNTPSKCYIINKKGIECRGTIFNKVEVYSLEKILSYNTAVKAIIGRRRGGKTYAVAERCWERYEKEGVKTIWVRRYTTEFRDALSTFEKFGLLIDKKGAYILNKVEKEVLNKKTGKYEIKWIEEKEYIVVLRSITTASRMRGGIFNEFDNIVWDEYGDESQTYRKAEDDLFYSIIVSTFDERENCEVWILSNNCNRFLKLWVHAEIDWDKEWNYNPKKDIVIHIWDTKDYDMKGSMARFLKETDYYQYAFKNQAMDTDNFHLVNQSLVAYLTPKYCIGFKNIHCRVYEVNIKDGENNLYYVLTPCSRECLNSKKNLICIDLNSAVYNTKDVDENIALELREKWWNRTIKFTNPYIRDQFIDFLMTEMKNVKNNKIF